MTTDDLLKMQAALLAAMGSGLLSVDTPQLGRVEYQSLREIQSALNWVNSQLEAIAPAGRTFVFQSNRGTGI
jgi:hypothetical protein